VDVERHSWAQTLTAYFLDSLQVVRDSAVVTATGNAVGQGWYTSGCFLPANGPFSTIAELPSGRVLASLLNQSDYPFYSDDDGSSWHRLHAFPAADTIAKLVTTAQNEILAGVPHTGVYYSNDGGQTWSLRATGLPLKGFSGDLQLTQSGKLFTSTKVGAYFSMDMGQTWSKTNGLKLSGFNGACSTTGGTLFGVDSGAIFRSDDGGQDWRDIGTAGADYFESNLMMAVGDTLFLGGTEGIFFSPDTGHTWFHYFPMPSYSMNDNGVYDLTMVNGTYYFHFTANYLLYETTDWLFPSIIVQPHASHAPDQGRYSTQYIVTKNGHYILSTDYYGVWYYNP
jgi:photosystem II stability/assembly factor-like uncharacterized protein